MSIADRILGPKISDEEFQRHRQRYLIPTILFGASAVLLVVSIFFPYWVLNLEAPQYPQGLQVEAFVNRLQGDVVELEGLNHYVGLRSFEDGAVLERSVSIAGIIVIALLIIAALRVRSRWIVAFVFPALVFPLFFVLDLQFWLWTYGHSLDPRAPFSAAVGDFTPPIFGPATIAQFETLALPGLGFIMAVVASILVAVGLWFHRKAYKPLLEEREAAKAGSNGEAEAVTVSGADGQDGAAGEVSPA